MCGIDNFFLKISNHTLSKCLPLLSMFSYTKVVVKGMTKAEMVLKVVMSPIENVRTYVEQFRKLLPDSDLQDLQRVLEMKV